MNVEQLTAKVGEYALNVMAPKAQTWAAKFAIGAGSAVLQKKVADMCAVAGVVRQDGTVDVAELHRIVNSGFGVAGHIDLLGGIVGFDPSDADDLFAYIGS